MDPESVPARRNRVSGGKKLRKGLLIIPQAPPIAWGLSCLSCAGDPAMEQEHAANQEERQEDEFASNSILCFGACLLDLGRPSPCPDRACAEWACAERACTDNARPERADSPGC